MRQLAMHAEIQLKALALAETLIWYSTWFGQWTNMAGASESGEEQQKMRSEKGEEICKSLRALLFFERNLASNTEGWKV